MTAIAMRTPPGAPRLQIIRPGEWMPEELREKQRRWNPRTGLGQVIRDLARTAGLTAEQAGALLEACSRSVVIESQIRGTVIQRHRQPGESRDVLGVLSRKVITTAGVGFLVDAWQNILELEIMKYHGFGTGSTAEAIGDTALVTELTTQYATDNTRPTGSLTEGASGNIFRTVGTLTPDASATIAEHGIFSQAATGGGTLWDRSLTGTVALSSGDSLQITYDMTASSGG